MSGARHSYVRFFPSDWTAGTARMSRLHRSVYLDICVYNWDKNAGVPSGELALMLSDMPEGMRYVDELIAAGKLVRCSDGCVANPRAMAEAKAAYDLWQRKHEGGKKGATTTNKRSKKAARSPVGSPAVEPEPEPYKGVEAYASPPNARDEFPKPDGVDDQHWRDFLKNRKRRRMPNTPSAHKRLTDDLARLAIGGWTVPALVEHAAAAGWGSINPPKGHPLDDRHPRANGSQPSRTGIRNPILRDYLAEHGPGDTGDGAGHVDADAADRPQYSRATLPYDEGG